MNEHVHPVMAAALNAHAARPIRTAERIQAELDAARSGFDSRYQYSDDHTFFCVQDGKASDIRRLTAELSRVSA